MNKACLSIRAAAALCVEPAAEWQVQENVVRFNTSAVPQVSQSFSFLRFIYLEGRVRGRELPLLVLSANGRSG